MVAYQPKIWKGLIPWFIESIAISSIPMIITVIVNYLISDAVNIELRMFSSEMYIFALMTSIGLMANLNKEKDKQMPDEYSKPILGVSLVVIIASSVAYSFLTVNKSKEISVSYLVIAGIACSLSFTLSLSNQIWKIKNT